MKIYEPEPHTGVQTIRQFGEFADRGAGAETTAQQWTDAGFSDEMTVRWLQSRCFTAEAARVLSELGATPEQCALRTRDGQGGYIDTIGYKVAAGDLTPRQGAARTLSSR